MKKDEPIPDNKSTGSDAHRKASAPGIRLHRHRP